MFHGNRIGRRKGLFHAFVQQLVLSGLVFRLWFVGRLRIDWRPFVGLVVFVLGHLYVTNSTPVASDRLSVYLSNTLADDSRILVAGTEKSLTEASVFLLNRANADYEIYEDTVLTINPTEAVGVVDYIIPLDGLEIQDIGQDYLVTEFGTISDLRNLSSN